jgi:hypothetical protein
MNMDEKIIPPPFLDDGGEPPEWPTWLDEKLRMAGAFTAFTRHDASAAAPEYHARCRQTALTALAQAKLRAEHERRGENFIPLALTDYLGELAQSAQVALAPLLARWDLSELAQPRIDTARSLGQLARSAGLSLLETLIHLRIGFALHCGLQNDLQALLTRRRSQQFKRNLLQDYAGALTQLEKKLAPAHWHEHQQIEHEIRAAYEENNN